jgi:hypothetical protein
LLNAAQQLISQRVCQAIALRPAGVC